MSIEKQSDPRFISKHELCRQLSISLATAYRWIRDGLVPTVSIGGRVLIPASFISDLESRAKNKVVENGK